MAPADVWKAHAALALVQFNFGGYEVITKLALRQGVNQLVFCALRDLLALCVLASVACIKEKGMRNPLNHQLVFSFFFLGLTGIFGNQLLFIIGLNLTSPTFVAALQPTIPMFTFVFAVQMGMETINWRGRDGKAKIAGTLICILGAIVLSLYKGPSMWGDSSSDLHMEGATSGKTSLQQVGWLANGLLGLGLDTWRIGFLCLIGNCLCMALYIAFQASVLAKYPAGLSITAYSYLFATILMTFSLSIGAHDVRDWALTRPEILAIVYSGVVASALNYGLLTWSNKVLGPATVSIYVPLLLPASSILSRIFLGNSLYLGSILGGSLIIAGLFLFIWGRREAERIAAARPHCQISNVLDCYNGDLNLSVKDPLLEEGPSNV